MHKFDKLYAADVIDNNDLKQEGRVQIYIEPLMWGIGKTARSKLPWARPFYNETGGDSTFGESKIPETNSKVWVWYEDDVNKKNPFYVTGLQLAGLNPHKLFTQHVAPSLITAGQSATYPDVKYTYYPNGICIGVSSSQTDPEIFIYHSPTTYMFIDKTGSMTITSPVLNIQSPGLNITGQPGAGIQSAPGQMGIQTTSDDILIKSTAGDILVEAVTGTTTIKGALVEVKSETSAPEPAPLGDQLKTFLGSLLTAIEAITVTSSAPTTPSGTPLNATQFETLRGQLTSLFSSTVKIG